MRSSNTTALSVSDLLEDMTIVASAPCRVNCGGTLDLPAVALPIERFKPSTVNIALNMRATVSLKQYLSGKVMVTSPGFASEAYDYENAHFDSPLGLFFAIAYYFGVHGLRIDVETAFPPRSGLGGSGALAVATIAAFVELTKSVGEEPIARSHMVKLAFLLEESLKISHTGMQDQAAAAFGGVNLWTWNYGRSDPPFEQIPLMNSSDFHILQQHILVAYLGTPRSSTDLNTQWLKNFLSGKERQKWRKIAEITHEFAAALKRFDWNKTAELLLYETEIRRSITSEAIPTKTVPLFTAAQENSCGARFAGAGGAGCLWAVGKRENIERLREVWGPMLSPIGGNILPCSVDAEGVTVKRKTNTQ